MTSNGISNAGVLLLASIIRAFLAQKEAEKLAAERAVAAFGGDAKADGIVFELKDLPIGVGQK